MYANCGFAWVAIDAIILFGEAPVAYFPNTYVALTGIYEFTVIVIISRTTNHSPNEQKPGKKCSNEND